MGKWDNLILISSLPYRHSMLFVQYRRYILRSSKVCVSTEIENILNLKTNFPIYDFAESSKRYADFQEIIFQIRFFTSSFL